MLLLHHKRLHHLTICDRVSKASGHQRHVRIVSKAACVGDVRQTKFEELCVQVVNLCVESQNLKHRRNWFERVNLCARSQLAREKCEETDVCADVEYASVVRDRDAEV